MEFFFKPKGIAILGASANSTKGGHVILNNVMKSFNGGVYPVNPRYSDINGIKCYPSVLQVPDPVDLAIIFVPAAFVPKVLRECAQRGIRGAMIESGGFAESGEQGKQLQENIIKSTKKPGFGSGDRIVWVWWMRFRAWFFLSCCLLSGKKAWIPVVCPWWCKAACCPPDF